MELKAMAARRAAEMLDGVGVLGLGTGSTATVFLEALAERRARGELGEIVGIPTSRATEEIARRLEIPLGDLDRHPDVELTVDGADEVAPDLGVVKGLGGALTREKIVAAASRRVVIVVDESKLVQRLGSRGPVPVEVIPFGRVTVERRLQALGARVRLRRAGGEPFRTDEDNVILDCRFPAGIEAPGPLALALDRIPGVVAHGLFLDMVDLVVVAGEDGVRELSRPVPGARPEPTGASPGPTGVRTDAGAGP